MYNTPVYGAPRYLIAVCLLLLGLLAVYAEAPVTFNRDIRPILSNNCFKCHGPDSATRAAGLRLDVEDAARADLGGYAALVPGDPAASELFQRLIADCPDEVMPPPEEEARPTAEEIARVRRWIEGGAEYELHWAYIAPVRPVVPAPTDREWPRNPIDNFVLAHLETLGMAPAAPADPVTLVRRLHFDLIGLPPDPEVVKAFTADPSDAAYAGLVESLLASAHYGERMAIDWLDQVRYADSNGYHSDEPRSVWPYRDYVINAFNDNMPFDQFTREQLAGDLMPAPTREQQIASGFNRLNQITAEGGAQAGEYLAMYTADRVRAVSSVWLGSTMGCAQCHDHKFDPFSAKDFYSMGAFFADIEESGVYKGGSGWPPYLELPTPDQDARLEEFSAEQTQLQATLDTTTPELEAAQREWEAGIREKFGDTTGPEWQIIVPDEMAGDNGTTFEVREDQSLVAGGKNPEDEIYRLRLKPGAGVYAGVRIEAIPEPSMGDGLSRSGNGNFVLTGFEAVKIDAATGRNRKLPIADAVASYEQDGHPISNALDDDPESGWSVDGHIIHNEGRQAVFRFFRPERLDTGDTLELILRHESIYTRHALGRFRIAITETENPGLRTVDGIPEMVFAAVMDTEAERPGPVAGRVASYYRSIAPALDATRAALAASEDAEQTLQQQIATTLITVAKEPREMRVLPRGNWMDASGEVVAPATPAFLPALDVQDRRATRSDLADWLVAPQNPLTARVVVNRLWRNYFGAGLTKVLDDLGAQAPPPEYPKLLDWLAVEFRESGWDVKHMVRLIVTSSLYRQDSTPTPALRERDPHNRLLARQTRFRLEAEMVRDNALAVSGLLAGDVGGPSVYPYQPDDYYANCNTFRGPLIYETSEGADQYRRGLYTVWKRSFLHPSMLAFDAPNREECTADRVTSNTPLQALVLLNDPTYIEAARVFAATLLLETSADDAARLTRAFEKALSRPPTEEEALLLVQLLEESRAYYGADPTLADALLGMGLAPTPEELAPSELAAWTAVTRAILNLHEFITRS